MIWNRKVVSNKPKRQVKNMAETSKIAAQHNFLMGRMKSIESQIHQLRLAVPGDKDPITGILIRDALSAIDGIKYRFETRYKERMNSAKIKANAMKKEKEKNNDNQE